MKKLLLASMLILAFSASSFAQCAMCRANAESNLRSGKNQVGRGLNQGILYLMSVPYLLAGVGVFIWIRNKRKD